MKNYLFTLKSDSGKVEREACGETLEEATEKVLSKELAPKSAIVKVQEIIYKVVKVFRVSRRRQIIERNLSLSEAQRKVLSFPDSTRSMVVYFRQGLIKV